MNKYIEVQRSIFKAEHHLKWARGNESAMRFKATLPGVSEEDIKEFTKSADWFKEQAESAQNQIRSLNEALAFAK